MRHNVPLLTYAPVFLLKGEDVEKSLNDIYDGPISRKMPKKLKYTLNLRVWQVSLKVLATQNLAQSGTAAALRFIDKGQVSNQDFQQIILCYLIADMLKRSLQRLANIISSF